MPAALVRDAIEQSKNREPMVRAMALLYGARALSAVDREAAKLAFAEGLALLESLPRNARSIDHVLHDAVRLGALADPVAAVALFRRLPADHLRHSSGAMLVQTLSQGGDFESALGLLEDLTCETGGAQIVVHLASDPAIQLRAMAAARARWRASRDRPDSHFAHQEFYQLFSRHWRKLPANERDDWVDEILQALEFGPDHPTNAGFGPRVEFHSTRDAHLFEILNVLRELKSPEQVEAILGRHPKVAEAAKVYPLGLESLMAECPPRPAGGGGGGGFMMGGSGRDRGLLAGMMAAHRGDPAAVQMLLEEARRLHHEDIDPDDPNLAPRVFWPSCHAYKVAMYWAGRISGKEAEALLAEIPDTDFFILASIEFAAGLLGLGEPFGVRMEHHPKRHRR